MKQLYCPWRQAYAQDKGRSKQTNTTQDECVFCSHIKDTNDDQNFILKRYKHNIVVLNTYPYNAGHLMIIPLEHVSDLDQLSPEARSELMELINKSITIMREKLNAQGINMGMNLGTVGGAGIPSHIHMHVVPRFQGDTNFMATIGQTRHISFDLKEIYNQLKPLFA